MAVYAKVEIKIQASHCRAGYDQCSFLVYSGKYLVCRAFLEPATRSKKTSTRAVRLHKDDFGRILRCQQCLDAEIK